MAKKKKYKGIHGHTFEGGGFASIAQWVKDNPEIVQLGMSMMQNNNNSNNAALQQPQTIQQPSMGFNQDSNQINWASTIDSQNSQYGSNIVASIANMIGSGNKPKSLESQIIPGYNMAAYGGNLFGFGGNAGGGKAANILGAVGTYVNMLGKNIQIGKGFSMDKYKRNILNYGKTDLNAHTNEELLDWHAGHGNIRPIKSKYDIIGGNKWSEILGRTNSAINDSLTGMAVGSGFDKGGGGAAAGAAGGGGGGTPYGAIIGAIVGGATGTIGNIFGAINANKKVKKLNKYIDETNARNNMLFANNVTNVKNQQLDTALNGIDNNMNLSAFGGPIFPYNPYGSQALSYTSYQDYLAAKEREKNNKGNNATNNFNYNFAEGGNIYIKPSKRGTFTAAAKSRGMGVQEFASKVLANKDDYSTAMVKKANFARNASHWHDIGGPMFNDFTNGVTLINNGGTHEMNRYGGVPAGVAPDGKPNLVEGNEAIYNDFVYSDRLRMPKTFKKKYKLRGDTFAEAFRHAQKESEERPNDPISKTGLDDIAQKLAQMQESVKLEKMLKKYGPTLLSSPEEVNTSAFGGYTFEDRGKMQRVGNPGDPFIIYDRKYKNYDELYNPNSEYMRELAWTLQHTKEMDDLINAINAGYYNNETDDINNFRVTPATFKELATDYKKGPVHNALIAMAAKRREEAAREAGVPLNPDGSIYSITSIPDGQAKPKLEKIDALPIGAKAAAVPTEIPKVNTQTAEAQDVEMPENTTTAGKDYSGWLRYVEPLGQMGNVITDMLGITNTPTVFDQVRPYSPFSFKPIGDYVKVYEPDRRYLFDRMAEQAGATRNAIMQSTSPSRNAALLAADRNAQDAVGEALFKGDQLANEFLLRGKEFNRGTNQFNSQMGLQAAMHNAQLNERNKLSLLQQAELNDRAETLANAAKAQNMSNLLTSISNIGRERDAKQATNAVISSSGRTLSPEMANLYSMTDAYIDNYAKAKGISKEQAREEYLRGYTSACGGRLRKRNKKRGLTY